MSTRRGSAFAKAFGAGSKRSSKVKGTYTNAALATFEGHTSSAVSVACFVLADGSPRIVSGGWDSVARIWDPLNPGAALATLEGHSGAVTCLTSFTLPDGGVCVVSGAGKQMRIWDPATGECATTIDTTDLILGLAVFITQGALRLVSCGGKNLKTWDPLQDSSKAVSIIGGGREQTRAKLGGHTEKVNGVMCFTLDTGKPRAVSASHDKTLKVWDPVRGGAAVVTLEGHRAPVHRAAYFATADERARVVSASDDRTLKVWDPIRGEELCSLEGHINWVYDVTCFATADGSPRVVSGSYDKTLKVWDPLRGVELASLEGHASTVHAVACFAAADGRPQAVSASNDKTVKVWEVVSSLEACAFHERHAEDLVSC